MMRRIQRIPRRVVFGVLLVVAIACGGGVRYLDVQDRSLPMETRRWLADAEDGVIVARSARDRARQRLDDERNWRHRVDSETRWGQNGQQAGQALRQLAEARVIHAIRELEFMERQVELARRKETLAHAERAMLHDLGQYNLVPLRESVDAAREQSTAARRVRDQAVAAEEQKVSAWWDAYRSYLAAGGERAPLWLGLTTRIERTRTYEYNSPDAGGDGGSAAARPASAGGDAGVAAPRAGDAGASPG